jgi:hypothetical protein
MVRRGRVLGAAVAAAVLVAASAAPGWSAPWSQFGGDAGRSGAQPVDQGGVPAEFVWSRTGAADRDIRTSVVVSNGQPADQRVAYGTEDGVIVQRVLLTGAPVGPVGGIDLGADEFPFGRTGSAGFVESSTPAGLGQVFSVHNELYSGAVFGLELAQIDQASGNRARDDLPLAGTIGYRIESSPLLTAPDAAGTRQLFFVAADGTNERLFRITITNASSSGAGIGTIQSTDDVNANPGASPTLVHLRNAAGTPTAYVAVSTTAGLRTFSVASLAAGPVADGLGGVVRTPSVPVTASGNPPGAAGSGVEVAPAIVVATGGSEATVVHRLTQTGNEQVLTRASSVALAGEAAPALALSPDGSRVVVSTSRNLYALRLADLAVVAKLDGSDSLAADTTGFRRTTAATTGAVVFVVTDGGTQLALELDTLQPVDGDLFTPARLSAGSSASYGQPAISRRFLLVTTDRGIFAYGLRRATPPTGYWLAASDGGIFAYGDAGFFGSTGDIRLNRPITTMAPTPSREGYWLAATDGGIFAFGDAGFFGSTGDRVLNSPVVGMVPTRSGLGYWLVAADGGVFAFGDAEFFGSTGDIRLNKPIVGMASTVTGEGYYLVASDGGIFAFGDAEFLGSTGDIRLNQPIVGMARVPAGGGYWLVASDGGVFAFGRRAGFFGSTGDIRLNSPIVGLTASATGEGYLFTAADGGVFAFGDAPFLGAAAELGRLNRPVVTIAAKP